MLLQVKVVLVLVTRRLLRGVVDGDEGGGAADDLGGGQGDGGPLGAALVGAGVVSIGAGDVGALVGHGALAVAAAVGGGLAVVVGAGHAGVAGIAGSARVAGAAWIAGVELVVPVLLLVVLLALVVLVLVVVEESRGLWGEIGRAEVDGHGEVDLMVHLKVVAGEGVLAGPAGVERRGGGPTAVVELLEAVVEAHAHAAVDAEVVVGLVGGRGGGGSGSDGGGGGRQTGDMVRRYCLLGLGLVVRPVLRVLLVMVLLLAVAGEVGVHQGGKVQAGALRVPVKGVGMGVGVPTPGWPMSGEAVVRRVVVAVHHGQDRREGVSWGDGLGWRADCLGS